MKIFALLFLLTCSIACFGQPEIKVDSFTGDTTVISKEFGLERTLGVNSLSVKAYSFKSKKGENFKILAFIFYASEVGRTDKQFNALLKFSDTSLVKLPFAGEGKVFVTKDAVFFSVIVKDETLPLLMQQLKEIRLETSNRNYDFKIREKFQLSIKEALESVTN